MSSGWLLALFLVWTRDQTGDGDREAGPPLGSLSLSPWLLWGSFRQVELGGLTRRDEFRPVMVTSGSRGRDLEVSQGCSSLSPAP